MANISRRNGGVLYPIGVNTLSERLEGAVGVYAKDDPAGKNMSNPTGIADPNIS